MKNDRGAVLVTVMMALALLAALALSLAVIVTTDMQATSNYTASREALHAADGGIEIAAQELLELEDWNSVLSGGALSRFVDGPPAGTRRLADGETMSLPDATAAANSEERPWGANNPRWQLFAFGSLGPTNYVLVWVADDPSENDGDPTRDGRDPGNPGTGIVALRAEAFGTRGARKVIEATVRRGDVAPADAVEILSWLEIR